MDQKTILIVEDEEIIRHLCKRLLEDQGHELVFAQLVQEALTISNTLSPDVLITDLKLPDGNGVDVIRGVKEKHKDIQLIVMTGSPTPEDSLGSIENLGPYQFLHKPFTNESFKQAVLTALADAKEPPKK